MVVWWRGEKIVPFGLIVREVRAVAGHLERVRDGVGRSWRVGVESGSKWTCLGGEAAGSSWACVFVGARVWGCEWSTSFEACEGNGPDILFLRRDSLRGGDCEASAVFSSASCSRKGMILLARAIG